TICYRDWSSDVCSSDLRRIRQRLEPDRDEQRWDGPRDDLRLQRMDNGVFLRVDAYVERDVADDHMDDRRERRRKSVQRDEERVALRERHGQWLRPSRLHDARFGSDYAGESRRAVCGQPVLGPRERQLE